MSNEELCLLYQQCGDPEKRRTYLSDLFQQNLGLIGSIVKIYSGLEDEDDLRQEAFFGLATAADRWSPEGAASFATYAWNYIRQAVRRYLDDCGSPLRIPVHTLELVYRLRRTVTDFTAKHGREPSDGELSYLMGISEEKVREVKKAAKQRRLRSTNEELTEDGSITLGDAITDPQNQIEEIEERLQHEQLHDALENALDGLKPSYASALRKKYFEGQTLQQIADEAGVGPERIRQRQAKGMRELRRRAKKNGLDKFIELSTPYYMHTNYRRTQTSPVEWIVLRREEIRKRQTIDEQ